MFRKVSLHVLVKNFKYFKIKNLLNIAAIVSHNAIDDMIMSTQNKKAFDILLSPENLVLQALKYFNEAIKLDPSDECAFINRAITKVSTSKIFLTISTKF